MYGKDCLKAPSLPCAIARMTADDRPEKENAASVQNREIRKRYVPYTSFETYRANVIDKINAIKLIPI
jgi:hypothetical protein